LVYSNGVKSGVSERMQAREGVAIVLKGELWSAVKEIKEVNARLMWVELEIGKEIWIIASAYGPGSERSGEERESFWEMLGKCLGNFRERERVIVMEDLNARVGDTARVGVSGVHGVAGVNDSGEYLLEVCEERGLEIGNTLFKKRYIHKYTWISGNRERKALVHYVLIDRREKDKLTDINV